MKTLLAAVCGILLATAAYAGPRQHIDAPIPASVVPVALQQDLRPGALDNAVAISHWLDEHHYDVAHRDAILHLMWHESRFLPCVIAKSKSSYLMQWVNPRTSELHTHAHTWGCPSMTAQLEFIDFELRTKRAYADFLRSPPERAYAVLYVRYGLGG